MNNPLLKESSLPYGAPQFDQIKSEDYLPAFEASIASAKKEIQTIIDNEEAPTFENTIEAMEFAGADLNRVAGLFYNIKEACTDPVLEETAEKVAPMMTQYSLFVSLNETLFKKVKQIYDRKDTLHLDQEGERLLEETYKSFARNGANLDGEKKKEFGEVSEKLSLASLKFGQNLLNGINAYIKHITDPAELAGMPKFVTDMAAAEAKSRNMEGWVFTLQAPSFFPVLKYAQNRELRKEIWMASNTKCTSGEFDNQPVISEMVNLRLQSARLLGYRSHAEYVLEEAMAKTPENVNRFLKDLVDKTRDFAVAEVKTIADYAHSKGLEGEFMPWDFSYYSEMYKKEKYDLSDEMLKPYFRLENVQQAVFGLAHRLYGITITEDSTLPVYHPDVKSFIVKDKDGSFLSTLYLDYFPRESKRNGAWMTEYSGTYIKDGVEHRPHINLVLNFTKPTETDPSLLTFDEVTTLLHEFGHSLHGMFGKGRYGSLTGTNVTRDFVELPSQIMENWAAEPEFLASFARHYQTGEVIPQELIDKIVESRNFLSGYAQMRQLSFGVTDMAWHDITTAFEGSVKTYEYEAKKPTDLMPVVDGTIFSTGFSHIFAGGYSAGYYSYKWSEVLEADAFSLFKEKGIFSTEVAQSFRDNLLSRGNIADADVLYRNFRGRDPRPEALMEKLGLVK